MLRKRQPVESIGEFVAAIHDYHEKWKKDWDETWVPWFRGEPSVKMSTRLQPTLYREERNLSELLYAEQELRLEVS
jgi:hypothetical protein